MLVKMSNDKILDNAVNGLLDKLGDIWQAYLNNELDDGARKFWGANLENQNTCAPEDIILYQGRGGKTLLTLADCRDAFNTMHAKRFLGSE